MVTGSPIAIGKNVLKFGYNLFLRNTEAGNFKKAGKERLSMKRFVQKMNPLQKKIIPPTPLAI